MSDDKKENRKLDRRSLLIGAAAGVAGTTAVAVGAAELQKLQRTMATPKALPDGAKPQVELSFADSHPAYTSDIKAPAGAPNIITIILDADYDVHRHFIDATRAYSNSYSTRIAQVENAGQPNESELPPGKDGGYLWRLNSFWRYFDTGRGVYVQCEAISLTRDIPAALNWLVGSFIESVPRESLEFTLQSTRSAVLRTSTPISK